MKRSAFGLAFAFLSLNILILSLLALKFGSIKSGWVETVSTLLTGGDSDLSYYVRHLRLPRVISALAAGASLAVSGAVLQSILNNPLASSFTLGLSQGAAFGASLAIITMTGWTYSLMSLSLVTVMAFAGTMVSSVFIMFFTLIRGMTSQGLILAGVAISALFGAATMFMQFFATETQAAASLFWTFGDLGKGGWSEAVISAAVTVAGLALAFRLSFSYDALEWGDLQASSLGIEVRRLRVISLLFTSGTTAVVTSFFGVIGFVGLVAPHMIRLLFPRIRHGALIVLAALFGGGFVLAVDLLAQSLMYPVIVPIGIISAFAGVPMFLFLLFRRSISYAQGV
jgi:iron complex transport system permease protein